MDTPRRRPSSAVVGSPMHYLSQQRLTCGLFAVISELVVSDNMTEMVAPRIGRDEETGEVEWLGRVCKFVPKCALRASEDAGWTVSYRLWRREADRRADRRARGPSGREARTRRRTVHWDRMCLSAYEPDRVARGRDGRMLRARAGGIS